jgi:hypothetical protein
MGESLGKRLLASWERSATKQQEQPYGELIYAYTRAQAIEDGQLIDVSTLAAEAGFEYPVAVTHNLWYSWIERPLEAAEKYGQSSTGRLWDVLQMLRAEIKANPKADTINFSVIFANGPRQRAQPELIAKVGPGDEGEPVITVMLEGDD